MIEELKEEQIVNKVGGRFKLSTLIQKRMVQLNRGGVRPLLDNPGNSQNLMETVIQEIMQDKIFLDTAGRLVVAGETAPEDGARVFLKMDTQGYDTAVFEGLGTALAHVVLLQSEVSLIPIYAGMPHWTESIATYEKNGFGVVGMFPVSRDSSRVVEYDCLLVKWNRKAE